VLSHCSQSRDSWQTGGVSVVPRSANNGATIGAIVLSGKQERECETHRCRRMRAHDGQQMIDSTLCYQRGGQLVQMGFQIDRVGKLWYALRLELSTDFAVTLHPERGV
jgi:hypothetical protein